MIPNPARWTLVLNAVSRTGAAAAAEEGDGGVPLHVAAWAGCPIAHGTGGGHSPQQLNEVSGGTWTKPQGDRGPPVPRPRTTLYGARRRVWPGIPSSSRCARKNSGARGLTGSTRSGRRNGFSGAPWNRTSTTRSSCRRLTFLCRQCPRSPLPVLLAGAVCASRSRWQNSWWKCRRLNPILRYVGLWSRSGHSSSSWSWRSCRCQKSSRFPRTQFNSVWWSTVFSSSDCRADRWHSCSA